MEKSTCDRCGEYTYDCQCPPEEPKDIECMRIFVQSLSLMDDLDKNVRIAAFRWMKSQLDLAIENALKAELYPALREKNNENSQSKTE